MDLGIKEELLRDAVALATSICRSIQQLRQGGGNGKDQLQMIRRFAHFNQDYATVAAFLKVEKPERSGSTKIYWEKVCEKVGSQMELYRRKRTSFAQFEYLLGWTARVLDYQSKNIAATRNESPR